MAEPAINQAEHMKPDGDESCADGGSLVPEKTEVCELTAEEQMALFEQSLKEEDWGHQPC